MGEAISIEIPEDTIDLRTAASQLARSYRSPVWRLYDSLAAVYGTGPLPIAHIDALAAQLEVKMTGRRTDPIEGENGEKARTLRGLEARNPGRLFYRMVFADTIIPEPEIAAVRAFLGA